MTGYTDIELNDWCHYKEESTQRGAGRKRPVKIEAETRLGIAPGTVGQ